jgi:hypothetical protein
MLSNAALFFSSLMVLVACSGTLAESAAPSLWTPGHRAVEDLALSLRDHPSVQAARAEVVKRYLASPPGQLADGKATLDGAVDELVTGMLLSTVTKDPAHPEVVWTGTLSYVAGDDHTVPASRYAGDSPDRIYRNIVVDPAYRYALHGKRSANPSLDFSFESLPGPGNWGLPPLAILQGKDIVVEDDGSFSVTVDASPANGRSNHLQMPPGTQGLLLRDTIPDWANQQPNTIVVKGLDAHRGALPTRDQLAAQAAQLLTKAIDVSLKFYAGIWQRQPNHLDIYVRDLGWGLLALNRLSIADDEALLVTLDLVGAKYFLFQVDDVWLRSVDYVAHSSTLNNLQTKPNADGTITFVVSKADPGVHNWIDTGGMNEGILVGRWELLEKPTDGKGAVREVRVVKLAEVAAALPDAARVSPQQRIQMLAARKADYDRRLAP